MRESFLTDDFLLRLCDHSLFYILLLRLHSRTSAHVCLLELDYDLQETYSVLRSELLLLSAVFT